MGFFSFFGGGLGVRLRFEFSSCYGSELRFMERCRVHGVVFVKDFSYRRGLYGSDAPDVCYIVWMEVFDSLVVKDLMKCGDGMRVRRRYPLIGWWSIGEDGRFKFV